MATRVTDESPKRAKAGMALKKAKDSEPDKSEDPTEDDESEADSMDSEYVKQQKQSRRFGHDDAEGDPHKFNMGFIVRPLDPKIFGAKLAKEQQNRLLHRQALNTGRRFNDIRVSDLMDETLGSKQSMFKSNDQVQSRKATFVKQNGSKTARHQGNAGNIFVFNNEAGTSGLTGSTDDRADGNKLPDFNLIHNRMSIDTDIPRLQNSQLPSVSKDHTD